MPLIINIEPKYDNSKISLPDIVEKEVVRYIKNVSRYADIEMVFLKSAIHMEDMLRKINKDLLKIDSKRFEENIKFFDSIEGVDTESVKLLRKVNYFRNKIAHELEYSLDEDPEFLDEINSKVTDPVDFKTKIINYFQFSLRGILYVKTGMEICSDFIAYKHNS